MRNKISATRIKSNCKKKGLERQNHHNDISNEYQLDGVSNYTNSLSEWKLELKE